MANQLIPAETVTILRSALLTELGNPAACLEQASMAREKERRPELFHEALLQMNATCVMLGVIGWCEPADPTTETAARIDFDVYRSVSINAMRAKLAVERDLLATRGDAEHQTEAERSGDIYRQAEHDIALIEAFLAHHDPGER